MGTIAEKLEYLDGTREKILTETNRLGVGLTEQDKFRDYAKGLHDGYVDILNNGTDILYDNMEKVSGSGSDITLQNTEEAPMRSDLEGDTQQKISTLPSGYTQLDYIESTGTQYINTGVIPTANTKIDIDFMYLDSVYDGWVPLYGERTSLTGGNFALYIYRPDGRLSPNYGAFDTGVYSTQTISNNVKYNVKTDGGNFYLDDTLISSCSTSGTFNSTDRSIWLFDIQQQNGTPQLRGMKARIYRCKFYESTTLIRDLIPCYRNSDNVIGMYDLVNDTFYNNIGTGTFNYGGIPNPDNPREIEVVSGRQEVSVVGKNLFKDGTTYTPTTIAWRDQNGNLLNDTNDFQNNDNYINLVANQPYTFSIKDKTNIAQAQCVYLNNGSVSLLSNISLTSATTFTPTSNLKVWIRHKNTASATDTLFTGQLEKGSTPTEYEEYKGQSYEINLGYNLFKTPYNESSTTKNGITFTINEDGSIHVEGTASAKTQFALRNKDTTLDLQVGNTYTFIASGLGTINSTIWLDTYATGGTFLGRWNLTSTDYYTTAVAQEKDTAPYIYITVENGAIINTDVKVWLYKGDYGSSIEYTPYKTPIELCKMGEYKDRIYKENGTWYLHKEIGKVVFTGANSENWSKRNDGDGSTTITFNNNISAGAFGNNSEYCNNFKYEQASSSGNEGIGIASELYTIYIQIKRSRLSSLDVAGFKTWLSTHNTIVYYVLATPTTEEITDSELINQLEEFYNAKSSKDVTYISVTSEDLPAILNVVAIKKYE